MTTSTTSTATPPKLPDHDLNLGGFDDGFRDVFSAFGKRESVALQEPFSNKNTDMYPPPIRGYPPKEIQKDEMSQLPSTSAAVPRPRLSWSSHQSEDELLSNPDSRPGNTIAPTTGPRHAFTMPLDDGEKQLPSPVPKPIPTTSHRSLEKPVTGSGKALRRSLMWTNMREPSSPVDDADAKIVRESLLGNKEASKSPESPSYESDDVNNEESLFEGRENTVVNRSKPESDSTPRPSHASEFTEIQLDNSIAAHARLAAQYEERVPRSPSPPNKIMTPSQFEHYRQQQELRRSNSNASRSDDSDESDFDEDDEAEKNREAERQRRQQEARLSVYRQQMMKVTGQQSPPSLSLRPEMSSSTPNLAPPTSNSGPKPDSGKSSDADDDEDIPLGILAAHGFPNRNRPPSRLVSSASIPNLRASLQPSYAAPGSAPDHNLANRGSLPVFARNLPRDPYFGASLVNPPNRESLAMGGGSPAYGGPPPPLHPGGLVGVIATEERARATRRGSPSAMPQTASAVPRPFTMMNMNMPSVSAPQPVPTPTEQAQIQLSQQMSKMVQMQMQMMQQMMQMQGVHPVQGSPQLPMPKHFPSPSLAGPNMRPASVHATGGFGNPPTRTPQVDHRTLSMLDSNMPHPWDGSPMPFNPASNNRASTMTGQGYAPSIAPSERSNIGMASRYRPISTVQPEPGFDKRASTFTSSTLKPWNDEHHRMSILAESPAQTHLEKSAPGLALAARPITSDSRTTTAGKQSVPIGSDDDDDDEGWAEMMKKREKKKSSWKMKRETTSLGELLSPVH